ncbi:MAG: hypothetical protein IJX80_03020, partial [Clostridia bacterium]|nr:hypothetical protein [Clostridia bacterium]
EETTDVTDIWGPPMSSYCYDLKDFYIYATTGSRDPDLYTHKATQSEVEYYWDIEPNARLLLDDIIPTDEFSDLIEFVSFTSDFFIYTFENITLGYFDIIIFYSDELKIEETFEKDGCTIQETPLVEGYRFDLNNSENKIYLSEVDGIQFYRKICVDGSKRYPVFVAWLDGFYFQIIIHSEYSYSRIFDNPKGHGIAAFFDDSQVAEALQKFKTAIENVPSSEPN